MEQIFKCKMFKADYSEDHAFLRGPLTVKLQIDIPHTMQVEINQCGSRTIKIESSVDVPANALYSVFSRVERLLMIFDGRFIPLRTLEFLNSDETPSKHLISYANHCLNNRLAYFHSSDFCRHSFNRLIDFEEVLTKELYLKWVELLDNLDIVHQVYLYALCGKELPTDVKCAFLIELAEPLVETLKAFKQLFPALKPGKNGTTLKDCLNALITEYGGIIFKKELSENYNSFLQVLVNSRKRIMHIKRNQGGLFFDGKESVLYAVKMYLLYRQIIFDLLDIDQTKYKERLKECTNSWNQWNDVLEHFMMKLL